MSQSYQLQQEILELFKGQNPSKLTSNEINSLKIYKGLVINSMESLLAKIFSELYKFFEKEWRQIANDYLEQYPSQSPIYNQLCKDFPEFIGSEFFKEKYGSNNYFQELVKYKWSDLEVYNMRAKANLTNGFTQDYVIFKSKFNIPLVLNYLAHEQDIDKNDDIEEADETNPFYIMIYRSELNTKTLILNKITREFIEQLALNKSLESIKNSFISKYKSQTLDIEKQINLLIDYLKNLKILLI